MWRFAPDVDPTTPEVYVAMERMIPTPWGTYRTSPSMVGANGSTAQAPYGSALLVKNDGTERWVVGTPGKLYDSDATGNSFTDRSGTSYGGSVNPWQFAQYGNVTIAVKLDVAPQASTTGNFANLAGSPPKAALIAVQSNAVMLANYNDGSSVPDGWWASDVGDHTQWTPGAGVDSAYGRLIQTPGPITALFAFGNDVYAFKKSSIYRGTYVGSPIYWNWSLVHTSIGVSSPNAVATDGQRMFLYGEAGAYMFDGATLTRVDAGVEKYLQSNYAPASANVVWSSKERIFCIGTTGNSFAAYCPDVGLWSVGADAAGSLSALSVNVTKIPPGYDRRGFYLISSNYSPYTATGTNYAYQASSITTGRIGADGVTTTVTRVVPLFVPDGDYSYSNGTGTTYPANIVHTTAATRGASLGNSVGTYLNTVTGRFDVNRAAKWHSFTVYDSAGSLTSLQGGMELAGLDITAKPSGTD